jgi:hypothetical protein
MTDELYCDGISEITVTNLIVRIDMMSLSATQRNSNNEPEPVFRQRVIMPVDAFANAVDLMQKALDGLVAAGAIRRTGPVTMMSSGDGENLDRSSLNTSPNFNSSQA